MSDTQLPYKRIMLFFCLLLIGILSGRNIVHAAIEENDFENEKNLRKKVDLMLQFAEENKYLDVELAMQTALKAEKIADSLNYVPGLLKSKRIIAGLFWAIDDYKQSLNYATSALQLAEETKDTEEKANILRTIGIVLYNLSEYNKSAEYLFQSLELYEKLGDEEGISKVYNSIGNVYGNQKDYEKAYAYYEKSLEIARKLDDRAGISQCLNNLAIIYPDTNNYTFKKNLLNEAIEINLEIGQKLWTGINYNNLAELFIKTNYLDSALYYYTISEDIFKECNNNSNLALTYVNLADFFIQKRELTKGLEYAQKALELGAAHKLPTIRRSALDAFANAYLAKGDTIRAFHYKEKSQALKDSLDSENNFMRIAQLDMLYQLNKLEQDRKLQMQKRDFHFIGLIMALIFIAVIIIISLVSANRLKIKNEAIRRQKLAGELELKNKELTLNVMSLMKLNELMSGIASKLMLIQKETQNDDTKMAIRKLVKELKKTSETQVLEEFELRFKQVHGSFYQGLLQDFADLTPNELKMCAFLRLNLSSKEISELTGQRIATIEIARSRLRKKLGLTHQQQSLVSFLSKY